MRMCSMRLCTMKYFVLCITLFGVLMQTGCSVIAVADAGVTVVSTVVKVGAKTVGAVVDAVIPDTESAKK